MSGGPLKAFELLDLSSAENRGRVVYGMLHTSAQTLLKAIPEISTDTRTVYAFRNALLSGWPFRGGRCVFTTLSHR